MLQKLGLKKENLIDHPWINKACRKAQQKVEGEILILEKLYCNLMM
jgi:preprotein translocase subunit SecA